MEINQDRVDDIAKSLDKTWKDRLFKDIEIYGLEGINGTLNNEQIFYLSNHRSHADSVFIPYSLNKYNVNHPYIIARKNMDNIFTKKIMNEKTGVIFFDPKRMSKRHEGEKERKKLIENLEEVLKSESDLLIFPESGRKDLQSVMTQFDTWTTQKYYNMVTNEKKKVYFAPIAVEYSPKTIEEPFLKTVRFFKNKFYPAYLGFDLLSFLTQPLREKPIMRVNFGEPVLISKFGDFTDFKNYAKENILKLHKEIS